MAGGTEETRAAREVVDDIDAIAYAARRIAERSRDASISAEAGKILRLARRLGSDHFHGSARESATRVRRPQI